MSDDSEEIAGLIAPKGRGVVTGDSVEVDGKDGHKPRPPGAGGLEDGVEQLIGGHGQRYNIAKELGSMSTDPSEFLNRGAMGEEEIHLIGLIIEQDEWVDAGLVDVHKMGYRRYVSSVSINGLARQQLTSIGVAEEKTVQRSRLGNVLDRLTHPGGGNKNVQDGG